MLNIVILTMPQIIRKLYLPFFKNAKFVYILFSIVFSSSALLAQQITGVWKGKIDRRNVELKIIKIGDSLTGTSYYYESANSYRRYSIKGYFDPIDNSVVWWDDQLIDEKKGPKLLPAKADIAYLSRTDFNCPGGTKMYLNGKASIKQTEQPKGPVDLQKYPTPNFKDEWDFIIDNYMVGANDPELIDSIGRIAFTKPVPQIPQPVIQPKKTEPIAVAAKPNRPLFIEDQPIEPETKTAINTARKTVTKTVIDKSKEIIIVKQKEPVFVNTPLSIKEKFTTRTTVMQMEIPLAGDSIELRFYDNAEVDGDSISIFLNGVLLQEHIRLTDKAYTIMLAVSDLQQTNDLVMVAENLGAIPPNTSFMVAMVDGKRYEARLESTENSSAAIRFVKIDKAEDHVF